VTGGELVEVYADAGLSGGKRAGREGLRAALRETVNLQGGPGVGRGSGGQRGCREGLGDGAGAGLAGGGEWSRGDLTWGHGSPGRVRCAQKKPEGVKAVGLQWGRGLEAAEMAEHSSN